MPDWLWGLFFAAGVGVAWSMWDHREWLAREIAAHLVIWADAVAFRQAAMKRRKEVKRADEDRVD